MNFNNLSYAELKAALSQFVVKLILEIIKVEGGYVNDPKDPGGATKFGVTEKVARAWGYTGRMQDLPEEVAFRIYLQRYYIDPGFDRVAERSQPAAAELTDTGINMGQGRAGQFLQQALTATAADRHGAPLYDALKADGQLGNKSFIALDSYMENWPEVELVKMLNCLQGDGYISISAGKKTSRKFTFGWLSNRVELPKPDTCSSVKIDQAYAAIAMVSRDVALELTDIKDQFGAKMAGMYIQRALNALNCDKREQPLFADLVEDGAPGSKTRDALLIFCNFRGKAGQEQLVKALNCMQGATIVRQAILTEALRKSTIEWYQSRIQMPCH